MSDLTVGVIYLAGTMFDGFLAHLVFEGTTGPFLVILGLLLIGVIMGTIPIWIAIIGGLTLPMVIMAMWRSV